MKVDEVADYVVVGAGSAGSILAARLCEAGASVILVESGGSDRRPDVTFPLGIASLYATANWKYRCAADPSKATGVEAFAAGKVVGGSGSINAMVYVRGRRSDYDGWSAAGCKGWSYDDVLPHFKAIENWVGGADEYRGDAGRIRVSWCGHHHEIDDAFIEAAAEAGHARNSDQNGGSQAGVARTQVNQHRGFRSSSARGFLRPLPRHQRPRLHTRTTASRILFDGNRAVGVDCDGRVLRARQEVLLSAGAIGTPALLLRSGVGRAGTRIDLPGVGENFQDHLVAAQFWECGSGTAGARSRRSARGRCVSHSHTAVWQYQCTDDDDRPSRRGSRLERRSMTQLEGRRPMVQRCCAASLHVGSKANRC